jgi:CRP-like cAMP-binding protein
LASPVAPPSNRLLDRLPARDRARVVARCERVALALDEVVDRPGEPILHVHFPIDSCISVLVPMGASSILEVALTGREGMYGIPLSLGVAVSPVLAVVQGAGDSWRMGAAAFRGDLVAVPSLRALVNLYTHVVMSQLGRTAGCNRFHLLEQRVALWLLISADRAQSPTFRMTHELLARMLGVRRVGVTEAASALQERNLIGYRRGVVTIVNRKGLERASCGCYAADRSTYRELFG